MSNKDTPEVNAINIASVRIYTKETRRFIRETQTKIATLQRSNDDLRIRLDLAIKQIQHLQVKVAGNGATP